MISILIIFFLCGGLIGLGWFCYKAYRIKKIHTEQIISLGKFGLLRFIQQQFFKLWLMLWFSLLAFIIVLLLSWQQTYQNAHKPIVKNSTMIYATQYWQPWIDHFKQNGIRAIYTVEKDTRYSRKEGVLQIQILDTAQDWPSSAAPLMTVYFCDNACSNNSTKTNDMIVLNHQRWQLQVPQHLMDANQNEVRATRIVFKLYSPQS